MAYTPNTEIERAYYFEHYGDFPVAQNERNEMAEFFDEFNKRYGSHIGLGIATIDRRTDATVIVFQRVDEVIIAQRVVASVVVVRWRQIEALPYRALTQKENKRMENGKVNTPHR